MKLLAITGESDLPETHILAGLAKRGHYVTVYGTPLESRKAILNSAGIETFELDVKSRLDLPSLFKIRSAVTRHAPDLIYAPTNRGRSASVLGTTGMRVPIVAYRGTMGHLSRWDPSSWITYFSPKVKAISCVSDAVREYLRPFISKKDLVTIYKGHDISWYHPAPRTALEEFGIQGGDIVIACTANIRPVKGVNVLLQAFSKIQDLKNVHLLIIGEAKESALKSFAQTLDRVHFTGFRRDASALVGATDIFVMASIAREGFPKAVIEACALGIPPIVSRVGGMVEQVEDGLSGLVVPPSNAEALALAMRELALNSEKRKLLGRGACNRNINEFAISRTINETELLFKKVIAEHPTR